MPSTLYPQTNYVDQRLDNLALMDAKLEAIRLELVNSKSIADTIVQDSSATPRYFIRQETLNDTTGLTSVAILNLDGTIPSPAPVAPLSPIKAAAGNVLDENLYSVAIAGVGYAVGEQLSNIRLFDGSTAAVVASTWFNLSTGTTIATAPPIANLIGNKSSGKATVTTVASSTTSATVLASNPLRKGARLVNNSTSIFFGLYGTGTASPTNYSFILAPVTTAPLTPVGIPSYEEIPSGYVGPIVGVWATVSGNLLVTDFV
jgi:hypothetical protein